MGEIGSRRWHKCGTRGCQNIEDKGTCDRPLTNRSPSPTRPALFREAGDGFGLGVEDVEDGQQLGDLQDFLELAAEVGETQGGALRLHAVMRGSERAESSAVDKGDVVHIEDNFLFSFGDQALYLLAQGVAFLA